MALTFVVVAFWAGDLHPHSTPEPNVSGKTRTPKASEVVFKKPPDRANIKSLNSLQAEKVGLYKDFDLRAMGDGTVLAKYGPIVYGYSGSGSQCGACRRVAMKIIAVSSNDATSKAFEYETMVDLGSNDMATKGTEITK